MAKNALYVILTSQTKSPRIFLDQILNSKTSFKLLQNENGRRYEKITADSKSAHSTESKIKIFHFYCHFHIS